MAQNLQRRWQSQLPPTTADKEIPFDFATYKLTYDGYWFVGLNFFIPFCLLVITSFTLNRPAEVFSALNLGVMASCLIASYLYFWVKSPAKLNSSGLLIFYFATLLPNVFIFVYSWLLKAIGYESQWLIIGQLWFQILGEAIVVWLALRLTTGLKRKIALTFKNNWKRILIIFIVGVLIMWGVSVLYNLIFKNTVLGEDSQNQNRLLEILLHPESQLIKIFYILTLFLFTVGIAPLMEELAYRHAWFLGAGNRWFGLVTAALYFGYLHVQSGDLEHILPYVLSGLVLAIIFNINRGNVVYSWMVHAGFNLVVLIVLII